MLVNSEGKKRQPKSANKGRLAWEQRDPKMAAAIREIVEPYTQTDPELKTDRRYTNYSAREVRTVEKGYIEAQLPSERTMRDILNRMNYRLKRIRKGRPLKKTEHTNAIFDNIKDVSESVAADPEVLEISIDTKTKVKLGKYSQGGKSRTDSQGNEANAWGHDPP